jgi:hypothetical protein
MMALSSLSLAYRTGRVDSLEHYKRIFPLLTAFWQSERDMTSDGILFTHFFLLLYNVSLRSSVWPMHTSAETVRRVGLTVLTDRWRPPNKVGRTCGSLISDRSR